MTGETEGTPNRRGGRSKRAPDVRVECVYEPDEEAMVRAIRLLLDFTPAPPGEARHRRQEPAASGTEEGMADENLTDLYGRARNAAQALHAQAAELLEQAKELERLTKDTPAWYAATRAKVEARAAPEQAEELNRVLEELGEGLEGEA